jgi:secreted PhoX family phosphatase
MEKGFDRRRFLEFMGRSSAGISASLYLPSLLTSCAHGAASKKATSQIKFAEPVALPFLPIRPSFEDKLLLADGFSYNLLASWGDPLNAAGELFGYDNDFTAFTPMSRGNTREGILWVNHESPIADFIWREAPDNEISREQVIKCQASVGGSLIHIKKHAKTGSWELVKNSRYNRRISGLTPIPFASDRPIAGQTYGIGTLGNCAGGVTPWGTVLSCEENFQEYYGELDYSEEPPKLKVPEYSYGWEKHFPYSPEHYGWVVEVEPKTGKSRKLVAMGRFCREGATVVVAPDGRPVVYSGDDGRDRCLYKFIGSKPGDLASGVLYVADFSKSKWVAVDISQHAVLQEHFKDQLDVLLRVREAAPMIGGTALDRPEDIEVEPQTKSILVSLTNNTNNGNYFGSLLRLSERDASPLALEFEAKTFLAGGLETGFACPDNLAFDKRGNLWMTNDISDSAIGKDPYGPFKNNGLYYIPLSGPDAARVFQVASAPVGAELTGLSFTPDGEELFLAVQHPGAGSKSLAELLSHWPHGGSSLPKPSVVTISGPSLQKLVSR